MKSKIMAAILAIGLISNVSFAYAAENETVLDSGTVEIQMEEVIETITTAKGLLGDSTFDVDTYESFDFPGNFQINAGELRGTPVTISNDGQTNFTLTAELCKSMDSNSPMVVRHDHFDDWATITSEETINNIAFGFLVKNEAGDELTTFWFEDESSQVTEEVYTVVPGETVTVEIIGKNGLSWEKACTLSYDCKVGIQVVPIEIVVEQPLEVVPPVVEPEVIPEEPEVPVVPEEPELIPDESEVDTPTEDKTVVEGSTDSEQADQEDKDTDVEQPEEPNALPSLPETTLPDEGQDEQIPEENTPAVDDNIQEDIVQLPDDGAAEDSEEQNQEQQEDTTPADSVPVDESKQVDKQ